MSEIKLEYNEFTFKRKYRWTVEANFPSGHWEETFVKVSARPNLKIEEIEIVNEAGEKFFVPGKQEWEDITFSYFDIPGEKSTLICNACKAGDSGNIKLRLYDGCGQLLEIWEFSDAIAKDVLFMDPEFIEVTVKYANVRYTPQKNYSYSEATKLGQALMLRPNDVFGLGPIGKNVSCPSCNHQFLA